jgi:diphthine synthase
MNSGQLIFIGLGLFDEQDVTLRGIKELQSCDQVFCEFYTSQLIGFDKKAFEISIGKTIKVLSREETEKGDMILQAAAHTKVGFLIGGDPMMATTHVDLRLRAMKQKIPTKIIHNASIITAAPGLLGLQNYKFGRTTTLAYPEKEYFPTSPYTVIQENKKIGLHTLVLLDIQADKKRYMTANEGLQLLLDLEKKVNGHLFSKDSLVCVVARAGAPNVLVKADTIETLLTQDFGAPLHCLVVPGSLHFLEIEALEQLAHLPAHVATNVQKQ